MIADSNLHEVPLQGYPFTWERGRGTANWIQERLDRVFVFESWLSIFVFELWLSVFLLCKLSDLIDGVSNHSLILLYTKV